MLKTDFEQRWRERHPHIPGWGLGKLPVIKLIPGQPTPPVNISRSVAPSVGQAVYAQVENASEKLVISIDFRGILEMPCSLWHKLGSMLHSQVLSGSLGADKRLIYVTGGDKEHLQTLQWVFGGAATAAAQKAGKRAEDRAAIVPATPKGYCGKLRRAYEEVFTLANEHHSLSNEELVSLVEHRYTFNNANNYLTALADLGLVYRQVIPRSSGGYASRAYAISVPEEVVLDAVPLI